jgi:hypothetical protein
MRVGESFGEACRCCGSTLIIIAPPSSAGRCAVCSPEAIGWAARLEEISRRHRAAQQHALLAAASEAHAQQRAERTAARRATVARWAREARASAAHFVRDLQYRARRPSQA